MAKPIGVVLLLIIALLILTACARHAPQDRVITVPVPVETRPAPPPELLTAEPPPPDLRFVAPAHPAASSALTPQGETQLRAWVERMRRKLRAWEQWAVRPGD